MSCGFVLQYKYKGPAKHYLKKFQPRVRIIPSKLAHAISNQRCRQSQLQWTILFVNADTTIEGDSQVNHVTQYAVKVSVQLKVLGRDRQRVETQHPHFHLFPRPGPYVSAMSAPGGSQIRTLLSINSVTAVARGVTCRVGYPSEQYYIVLDAQSVLNQGHPDGLSLWATMWAHIVTTILSIRQS